MERGKDTREANDEVKVGKKKQFCDSGIGTVSMAEWVVTETRVVLHSDSERKQREVRHQEDVEESVRASLLLLPDI